MQDAICAKLKMPWVLKPRVDGCRSKNVYVCYSEKEVFKVMNENPSVNFLIQEYIDGDEYTCGTVSFDGKMIGSIQMKRELRNGDTYKAYVEDNPKIKRFLDFFISKLKPFGPCNVQLRMKDGIPYTLEINARCSGTTAARAIAGFNEPEMVCDYLSGIKPTFKIKEIAILRYWNEIPVEYNSIKELESEDPINRGNRRNRPRVLKTIARN
jgi:carbamoyl-phosphate synthase large subunit